MIRSHKYNWVEHPSGFHVYLIAEATEGRSRKSRPLRSYWVPRLPPGAGEADYLRWLADILDRPLNERPTSEAEPRPASPSGGPQGEKPSTLT